jgi:hypothetical protein
MTRHFTAQEQEEQEWRKRLRAHDRKLMATVIAVLIAVLIVYFAALYGMIALLLTHR